MAKYKLSRKAVADLTSIWEYSLEKWSENQADRYYQSLIQACEEVAGNPDIGKKYHKVALHLLGLKTQRHIIFYRKISSNEVEIVRILHEMMDLKNLV